MEFPPSASKTQLAVHIPPRKDRRQKPGNAPCGGSKKQKNDDIGSTSHYVAQQDEPARVLPSPQGRRRYFNWRGAALTPTKIQPFKGG